MPLFAAWECSLLNSLEEDMNTRVFLKYTAPSDKAKHFLADIRFRLKDTRRDFFRKETRLSTSEDKIFIVPFSLPIGEYEVDIDIRDIDLGTHTHLVPDELYKVNGHKILLSDIYLSYDNDIRKAFEKPIINKTIPAGRDKLFYFVKLKPPRKYDDLSIRAFLFIDKDPENREKGPIRAFESLYQTNRVINLKGKNQALFSDTLELHNLNPGEYMLSIEFFHDASRLARENARFILGGDIKQRILHPDSLDNSIRMSEYVLPTSLLDTLLNYPPEIRQEGFMKAWQDLYGEEAEQQIEGYFTKIFEANNRYTENVPGWMTDRGQIFIKYGEPEEEDVTIKGNEYVRWRYTQWSLAFLFQKRNNTYVLVE